MDPRRELLFWRLGACVLGVGLLAGAGKGMVDSLRARSMSAREFRLVDSRGVTTALLAGDKVDEQPFLALYDDAGRVRLSLHIDGHGWPKVLLVDDRARIRKEVVIGRDDPILNDMGAVAPDGQVNEFRPDAPKPAR